MKIKEKIVNYTLLCIGITVTAIIAIYLGAQNLQDTIESKKAERVMQDVKRLRIALEKYYQITGKYPELSMDGANNNLKILDYIDKNGKKISFAEIYGEDKLPKTPKTNIFPEKNEVFDRANFDNGTETGGWNYDYSNQTGEIHANLIKNVYSQGIDWKEY